MSIKPFSFVVLILLTLSCGSSKQITSVPTETNVDGEEQHVEVEAKETYPTENIAEIETTEVASTEVKIEVIKPTIETDSTLYIPQGNFVVSHDIWNELLQKHVSNQGNVNYKGFKADKTEFYKYLELLSETPPQESWSKDETLAYWMNVYNAFTVKLILDNYPIKSIKAIDGPWNQRFIKIGKKWYTLNDVEHSIIRKMDEPRIHFALVCAAVSCPRLYNKAFTSKTLESDLELLTRGFINDPSKNELSENSIKLSKIFKWYGGDFKNDGKDVIDFLNQYTDVQISSKAKKSYKDYNWNLND